MSKHQQRVKMKALCIAKFIVESNVKLLSLSGWQSVSAAKEIENKAMAMSRTPAHLFRRDKPKLDKRRFARHNRKMLKNSWLVRENKKGA